MLVRLPFRMVPAARRYGSVAVIALHLWGEKLCDNQESQDYVTSTTAAPARRRAA